MLDRVDFPILSGNFDVSGEPLLAGKMEDRVVLEIDGEKVGVIGGLTVDTTDISSPGDNVTFQDAAEYAAAAVAELEAMGVNKIIMVSHLGYNEDQRVAAAVPGIDVIVGGHSNTRLSNDDPSAEGPYPTMVGTTAIVSAYAYGKYLGELGVTFDDDGNVIEVRCTYDPESKGGNAPDGRKVKGTIHWVSARHAINAEVRLYDRLFQLESPDDIPEGQDWKDGLNPDSLEILTEAKVEPSLANAEPGSRFQFERNGYFCVDPDSTHDRLTFNRTATLRDSWAKKK